MCFAPCCDATSAALTKACNASKRSHISVSRIYCCNMSTSPSASLHKCKTDGGFPLKCSYLGFSITDLLLSGWIKEERSGSRACTSLKRLHCFTFLLWFGRDAANSHCQNPSRDIHLARRCPWRLANQFLRWLEMAVSPLAPRGFQSPQTDLAADYEPLKCDDVRRGYGSGLKANRFLARGKRKMCFFGGCLGTVGLEAGMSERLAAHGVWKLPRGRALIKARLPRRRQLVGCVYMHRVTLLSALMRTPDSPTVCLENNRRQIHVWVTCDFSQKETKSVKSNIGSRFPRRS